MMICCWLCLLLFAIIMLSIANAQNYLIFGGEVAASSGINVKTLRAKVILGASLP